MDSDLLKQFGTNDRNWADIQRRLRTLLTRNFMEMARHIEKDLFVGFHPSFTMVSLLIAEEGRRRGVDNAEEDFEILAVQDDGQIIEDSARSAYQTRIKSTAVQHLITKKRNRDFIPYSDLVCLYVFTHLKNLLTPTPADMSTYSIVIVKRDPHSREPPPPQGSPLYLEGMKFSNEMGLRDPP